MGIRTPSRIVGPDGRSLYHVRQPAFPTEAATIATLYAFYSDGASARRKGTDNPHKVDTVPSTIFLWGFMAEDLRQRLMAVDPVYRASQEAWQPEAVVDPKPDA